MIREEFYRPPELILPPDELVPLDSTDPLDAQMIEYHDTLAAGEFLDAAEQEMLVRGIRGGNESSAQALKDAYAGLVATVVFPFKGHGVDSNELLHIGGQGLVVAAQAYRQGNISHFDDKVVYALEWALTKAIPEAPKMFSDPSEGRPMEQVHRFLGTLEPSIKQEVANRQVLEGLHPQERKIVPLLHLGTHDDIAEALGPPATRVSVNNTTARLQIELGVHNTTSLALVFHAKGYRYPIKIPEKPLVELLTDHQMKIGNLLHHEYGEIGTVVGGRTAAQITGSVHKMRRKTGARSRTELALMIAMFDTGERRDPEAILTRKLGELASRVGLESLNHDKAEELVAELEHDQHEAISSFYLTGRETSRKEIASQLNISERTVRSREEQGIRVMRKLRPTLIEQAAQED
ncbi:MAG: sigma factor-like helix-turn-helix DNA-binding protein [Candidatus Saccharimonadales bacterium]